MQGTGIKVTGKAWRSRRVCLCGSNRLQGGRRYEALDEKNVKRQWCIFQTKGGVELQQHVKKNIGETVQKASGAGLAIRVRNLELNFHL